MYFCIELESLPTLRWNSIRDHYGNISEAVISVVHRGNLSKNPSQSFFVSDLDYLFVFHFILFFVFIFFFLFSDRFYVKVEIALETCDCSPKARLQCCRLSLFF